MAERELMEFLAAQTLLLRQIQKESHERAQQSNAQAAQFGVAMENLQKKLMEVSTATVAPITNITQGIQNFPWPSPLEVDTGDIYENFNLFKINWHSYCVATGIDKWDADQEKRKINVLLTVIGDKAKVKYNNFALKDEELATTAENVLKLIGERLVSERNLLYDRYMFHTCDQRENEPFGEYLVRLKKNFEVCR